LNKLIPYMAVFDAHAGWATSNHGGIQKVVETHSAPAWAAAVEFARDFRPDILLFGGDQVNCGPISHHEKGKPGKTDGATLKEELELCADLLVAPLCGATRRGARIIWHRGNHERWFDDMIDEQPALRGLTSIERQVGLPRKAEVYSYGDVSHIGKCAFVHGENIRSGRYPARWALNEYQRNIRFGHFHTYDAATMSTPVDVTDAKTAICVPALANTSQPYANNAPNRCLNGWLYGYVDEATGNFFDTIVTMVDGVAVIGGKVYGG
jgi:hypothetical protein